MNKEVSDSGSIDTQTEEGNKELGRRGELAAVRYLRDRGYEILERNWVCSFGEADIIARENRDIVFVEVKTRTNIEKGYPSEAVDAQKRHKYEKIALSYLKSYGDVNYRVRFDVISLIVLKPDRAMLRHHVNAFSQA